MEREPLNHEDALLGELLARHGIAMRDTPYIARCYRHLCIEFVAVCEDTDMLTTALFNVTRRARCWLARQDLVSYHMCRVARWAAPSRADYTQVTLMLDLYGVVHEAL